jgi:hypothetical protein
VQTLDLSEFSYLSQASKKAPPTQRASEIGQLLPHQWVPT